MSKQLPMGCIVACGLTIIIGFTMLIIGSVYTHETNIVRNIWIELYSVSIYSIIISIFAILFAAGLLYVAIEQHPVLTAVTSGLLLFVAFLAVICGVVAITARAHLPETTFNKTVELFRNYSKSDQATGSKQAVTEIQQNFDCCGVTGPENWKDRYFNGTGVPDSCCIDAYLGCGEGALYNQSKIYQQGCVGPIRQNLNLKYAVLISMNFTIMVLAIASAGFGIIYERYIREQYETM